MIRNEPVIEEFYLHPFSWAKQTQMASFRKPKKNFRQNRKAISEEENDNDSETVRLERNL